MKCKITRLLSLFMVLFTMSLPVLASSHYSKVVATAVGDGKVYASKSQTNSPKYTDGSSEANTENSISNDTPTNTYYLYAQANDGSEFVGWFGNSQCSGEALSTDTPYKVDVTATSTDSNNPSMQTLYAKFKKVGIPSLVYSDGHVYVNITQETYKNETLTTENVTETITYESSNTNVATVATDGTVTLKKNGSCYIKAKSGEGEGAYILTVIDDVAAGKTQIGNGDFEDWRGVTSSNHAPDNWNSFETNEGDKTLASMARAQQVQMVEDRRPGSDGFYCADIYSRDVMLGIIAQGNLTTGCINAGSSTADDKKNYNYSKTSDTKKSEKLSKIPSAIRFWAKFVPAKTNSSYPNALMEAVVHDNYDYITYCKTDYESPEEKSHVMARAKKEFPSTNGEWQEFKVSFVKTANAADGQLYIIVNLATNAIPAKGQEGDHLYIDDVELLYETDYDEVPVEMTDAKYATFCAPYDVNVPYGMKAYTVDGVLNNTYILDLTEVTGTIPANTPVILEGENEKRLTAYGVAAPANAEDGLLTGVYENTPAPVGSYVLQNNNDKVGFYQVAAGKQPTVNANRCYLTAPVPKVKAFYFNEEDATGIENLNVNENLNEGVEAIYNVAGQRINKLQKGINIINGKKILK